MPNACDLSAELPAELPSSVMERWSKKNADRTIKQDAFMVCTYDLYIYIYTLCEYIYIYMHVCMYACIHVCMYACMHVCMYACMHVFMYAWMHVCMYVCMHEFMYACMHVFMYAWMHGCMDVCMYVGMYVRMYYTHCIWDQEYGIIIQMALLKKRTSPNFDGLSLCRITFPNCHSTHWKSSIPWSQIYPVMMTWIPTGIQTWQWKILYKWWFQWTKSYINGGVALPHLITGWLWNCSVLVLVQVRVDHTTTVKNTALVNPWLKIESLQFFAWGMRKVTWEDWLPCGNQMWLAWKSSKTGGLKKGTSSINVFFFIAMFDFQRVSIFGTENHPQKP